MDAEDLIWLPVTGFGTLRIAARYNSEIITRVQRIQRGYKVAIQDAVQVAIVCLLVFSSDSTLSVPEGLLSCHCFVTMLHFHSFFFKDWKVSLW